MTFSFTEENVCLKLVDLSWNYIGRRGGVKLCDCLKVMTPLKLGSDIFSPGPFEGAENV